MPNDLAAALAGSELIYDRASIDASIRAIATLIDADYADVEPEDRPVYLTVMHGGLLFAAQLALELRTDLEFDYLHATRYRGATTGSGLAWLHRPATTSRWRCRTAMSTASAWTTTSRAGTCRGCMRWRRNRWRSTWR